MVVAEVDFAAVEIEVETAFAFASARVVALRWQVA